MPAYTEDDLRKVDMALVKAATSGVFEVEFNGQRVKYKTAAEVIKLRDEIARAIRTAKTGLVGGSPSCSKGLI